MNKRHYEHTLPNIRGSLSNTYQETFPMIIGEEEIPNPLHRRTAVRRTVPGGESGQVGGRVLRPADRILCTIQSRGGQLQPNCKGVA